MGERVIVTTEQEYRVPNGQGIGIYLHWHGDCIEETLAGAKDMGYRHFDDDHDYALARLIGFLANECGIGESTGIGVGRIRELPVSEYGIYIVSDDWQSGRWVE